MMNETLFVKTYDFEHFSKKSESIMFGLGDKILRDIEREREIRPLDFLDGDIKIKISFISKIIKLTKFVQRYFNPVEFNRVLKGSIYYILKFEEHVGIDISDIEEHCFNLVINGFKNLFFELKKDNIPFERLTIYSGNNPKLYEKIVELVEKEFK